MMGSDVVAILITSAFQTTMQATAIFMLYQQGRMLTDMNQMVMGANQLAAASVQMSDLVKEVRELLPRRGN